MPAPQIRSTEDETLHREMERVSLDWVMIKNPTEEDFYIEWAAQDGRPWKYLVPNKSKDIGWGAGKLEVQRYLAIWYCKHMKDKIINDKGQELGEAMLAKRRTEGKPDLTKYEEQALIWGKTPRSTSESELSKLYPQLFLGITREFGTDYAPNDQVPGIEVKTPEEKVLEELQNKKYTPEQPKEEIGFGEKMKLAREAAKAKREQSEVEGLEALIKNG